MAELATIARPYAEALFRVASSGNGVSDMVAWSNLVSEMSQLGTHPDMQAMANNPNISDEQVAETFFMILKSKGGVEVKNFIQLLIENGRLNLLPEIGAQFQMLKNAREGAADAQIVSAFEMSGTQVRELVATLEKRSGRKLNPTVSVDSSLIGGVRVVVGDEVLDTSVRAKLEQMEIALTA